LSTFTTGNICVNSTLVATGMTPLGRNWCRWKENIIFSLKEMEGTLWTGLIWLWIGMSGMFLWIHQETSGSIKGRIFL